MGGCKRRPVRAHHVTGAGMALKAKDADTLGLCDGHHADLHEFTGPFFGWSREQRAIWQLEQAAAHRARRAAEQAAEGARA